MPAPLRLSSTTHGVAFDQEGRPVTLDGTTILKVQEGLISTLRARLDKTGQQEFDAELKAQTGGSEGDKVYANAVAIGSLIDKVEPDDAESLRTQNVKLLTRYGGLVDKPVLLNELSEGKTPAFVDRKLTGPIIKGIDIGGVFGPLRPIYLYARRCAAAGVPVPPPLNVSAPSGGWTNAGEQKVSYLEPKSAGGVPYHPNKFSQMFYWIPSGGGAICIANPIVEDKVAKPNSINAFGVICQSLTAPGKPSHACFWDNATDDMAYNSPHDVRNAADFNAPPHLPQDNQCTDCHSGGHAYIVMPKFGITNGTDGDQTLVPSAIEEALKAYDSGRTPNFHSQDNYFVPLVDPTWPQNVAKAYAAGPATDPNDAATCGGCHGANGNFFGKTLPNVAGVLQPRDQLFKFCSFVLPDFLTAVHDPNNYYDGAMRYQAATSAQGVTALYNACKGIFPGGYFPASTNAWLVHRDPP